MEEIKGKVTTAISYAKTIEIEAREQIRRMCNYEFTRDSKVRIMPDVHAGAGCTIGTTMTVVDKAVPNVVGVDIGCGMYTVKLNERDIDFAVVDEAAHFIPSGRNTWDGRQENFDLTELCCYRQLNDTRRLVRSLGTLGGGNHFIEIDRSDDGTNYLVVHSGSRNLGKQVAELYQKLAIDLAHGKEELFERQENLIAEYKAKGRRDEIQKALKQLKAEFQSKKSETPADLCFVYGKYFEQYLHDVALCQKFARRNREMIAHILMQRAGLTAVDAFHTIHNYIDTDEMILRKGAIAAHDGERVLIVEDIVTTGGSIKEVINVVKEFGGTPVAVSMLVDRSGGKVSFGDVPSTALLRMNVETYQPDDCPLCKQNIPITKRGSTGKK